MYDDEIAMCCEQELLVDDLTWSFIGAGGYKRVYKNSENNNKLLKNSEYSGPWVYQIRHNKEDVVTEPERQSRVLKEVNPGWAVGLYKSGVITPFFKGHRANDIERVEAIIDIYKRTGRIVRDGLISDNILSNKDDVACVDVDVAFRPASPTAKGLLGFDPLEDKEHWSSAMMPSINESKSFPKSYQALVALCYLESVVSYDALNLEAIGYPLLKKIYQCHEKYEPLTEDILLSLGLIDQGRLSAKQP